MILLVKRDGGLFPSDEASAAALARIKDGATVSADIKRPRNPMHHRKFFALIGLCWDNSDHDRYPSRDMMRAAIQFSAGLVDTVELPRGQRVFIPRSIAFGKMDQAEFSEFYDRVCDVVARHFLGCEKAEVVAEVERMIGART